MTGQWNMRFGTIQLLHANRNWNRC